MNVTDIRRWLARTYGLKLSQVPENKLDQYLMEYRKYVMMEMDRLEKDVKSKTRI